MNCEAVSIQDNDQIAFRELATRCRAAGFLYPVAAVTTLAYSSEPLLEFKYGALVVWVFLCLALLRRQAALAVVSSEGQIPPSLKWRLTSAISLSGVLWGVFTAYAVVWNENCQGWLALTISVGIVAGAMSTMAPSFGLFLGFTGSLLLPSAAMLLLVGTEQESLIGWIVLVMGTAATAVGHSQSRNYWHHLVENRQQLSELATARERLELVVSGSNLGTFDWRLDAQEIYLDHWIADLLGYSAKLFSPFSGQWEQFLFSEDVDSLRRVVRAHIQREDSPLCEGEVRLKTVNGEPNWFMFRGRVVQRDKKGRPVRVAGTYQDINRQKQTEAALSHLERHVEQADKLKTLGILAGGVAHDFNNLLTAFIGNIEMAEWELPQDSNARDHLERARTVALDASSLSDQLLAYAGEGRYILENISLNRLLEEICQRLESSLEENLVLELKLADNLPAVSGDITQVRQVILSLLTNAAEAMKGSAGQIGIHTNRLAEGQSSIVPAQLSDDQFVCVQVSDQGCGLDETTLERMFDPFFTTKFFGRGLGLAAAKGIARSHGGDLIAENLPEGGARLRLFLPICADPDAPPVGSESLGSQELVKILVVDEHADVLAVAGAILARAGHEVLVAETPAAALEQLTLHQHVALLIFDMATPSPQRLAALEQISRAQPKLPILLSSGYNEEEFPRALETVVGFIKKPYSRQGLLDAVHQVLVAVREG